MRLLLYALLLFCIENLYPQLMETDIIGKWIIKDVINNSQITSCYGNIESRSEEDKDLKKRYIDASIEFLASKELIYRDKKSLSENDKDAEPFIGLYSYRWKVLNKNEIEFIELPNDEGIQRFVLQYKNEKIYFDFIGILFIIEKTN